MILFTPIQQPVPKGFPCAPIMLKWYPRLKHALCRNLRNVFALQVSKAHPSLAKRRSISKCYTLSVQDISFLARKARVPKAFPKPALLKNHNTIILLHFSTNTFNNDIVCSKNNNYGSTVQFYIIINIINFKFVCIICLVFILKLLISKQRCSENFPSSRIPVPPKISNYFNF